ncbi:hypothetical protein CEE37_12355 [candidate division LCP-89 bacterium B3_LCP]|uniref:Uncharacterized protein n=1 Tax=candidate division LCP-89 bacterium B3_LCP TaxID=2012998 RepID=A0A532UUF6_UNCL8|nr:MAG: hypothetical protein CEE37_12355 [candidate division LCP-89 bacterium B3_LCP]
MQQNMYPDSLKDMISIANELDFPLTQRKAKDLLLSCEDKLDHAVQSAIKEVLQEEVERAWLDDEDRRLCL